MKNYKDPTVKVVELGNADIITSSGENTDTSTTVGGNILGSSTPTSLGIGGSQQ